MQNKNNFLKDSSFIDICDVLSNENNSNIMNFIKGRKYTRYSDIEKILKNNGKRKPLYLINKLIKSGMIAKKKTSVDSAITNYSLTFKGTRALEIEKHLYKHIEKDKSRLRK